MKLSEYKSYDDLPLFLNAEMVAKVLGASPSSGYELMLVVTKSAPFHPACPPGIPFTPLFLLSPNKRFAFAWGPRYGFPVLRVGSRMVVPKDAFIRWVESHTGGGG